MKKHTILVVDDEPHVRRVVRLALEKAGYHVELAEHGADALHKLSATIPDALITDYNMPVMNGRQLVENLRSEFPERLFPVFVMTSLTGREGRDWTRTLKNVHFLEKPISPHRVIAQLAAQFAVLAPKAADE